MFSHSITNVVLHSRKRLLTLGNVLTLEESFSHSFLALDGKYHTLRNTSGKVLVCMQENFQAHNKMFSTLRKCSEAPKKYPHTPEEKFPRCSKSARNYPTLEEAFPHVS